MKNPLLEYSIDAGGLLEYVGPEWTAFARDNGAPRLGGEDVIGRPLLGYVSDVETRHLYELLLDKVRRLKGSVTVPFRCDGPAVRRFMELEISHRDGGGLRFASRLLREEPRGVVPLLDTSVARAGELIEICSWCKRVEVSGGWLEIEEAVRRLELFHEPPLPRITHGICGDCTASVRAELDAVD